MKDGERALEIPLIRRHRSSIDRTGLGRKSLERALPPGQSISIAENNRVRFLLILSRSNRKNLNYNACSVPYETEVLGKVLK